MSVASQLMLTIVGVHLLGLVLVAVLMIPALRGGPTPPKPPSDPGSDDGWGNDRRRPPSPPELPGGGIPLPDAQQSRVRLRQPGRLAARLPARERRRAPEPDRVPVRR